MMMDELFDLTGRVALVTGGSRGIGEAIARLLARHGARVIVSSRKHEGCEAVAASIRQEHGKARALACHVGDMDQIEAAFADIQNTEKRLDILVNNAAANPYYGHVLDTPPPAFEKTVEVNMRGYFYMSVHGGRMMRNQGKGVIVNVASVNGVTPGPRQAVYSMTKAAIISMTKAFAIECGNIGIRVNALLPGLTRTRFAGALTSNDAALSHYLSGLPLGRVAEPPEIAAAALYLASDAASYATGSCITVDGGYLA